MLDYNIFNNNSEIIIHDANYSICFIINTY